jgi:hypothetical protein
VLLGRLALDDDKIGAGVKRVPTFYSWTTTDGDVLLPFFAGIGLAMVFGGIHCVAWSFQFPSHIERLLWRMSSLTITCVPALDLASAVLVGLGVDLGAGIITVAIVPYIVARIMLLVLPFMALRSLPIDAYQTVHWTTFIPHV